MSTLALACHRRRINPALIITLLAAAGVGCLAVALAQLVTTVGPLLLAAGAVALAGWLLKAVSTAGLPTRLGVAAVLAVTWPWFGLAVLVWLLTREGGGSDG